MMVFRSIFGSVLIGTSMLGALMVSQSASALSCVRPDIIRTLEEAKASPKIYHVLVGRFVSRERHKPHGDYTSPQHQFKPRPPRITRSLFEGVSLSTSPQYDYPLSGFPVDIETSCAGPWCGSAPDSSQDIIAFVEARRGQPPVLRISACPSQTFPADWKNVQKVRQCLDQTCEPEPTNW